MKTPLRLLQTHTHAGRACPPGEIIEVDSDLADWLIALGVAQLSSATEPYSDSEPATDTGSPLTSKEKRK